LVLPDKEIQRRLKSSLTFGRQSHALLPEYRRRQSAFNLDNFCLVSRHYNNSN